MITMAQLFFRYGAMNSGKSIELLKVAHNYREQGKEVLLLTSALDNRSGIGQISSRIGISAEATPVGSEVDVYALISEIIAMEKIYCVLVDESQFLSKENVYDLSKVVDDFNVPVICYGLKTDFMNNLFEGSEALLIYSDKLEEIKTICKHCAKKATLTTRLVNGTPVYSGEQVQIGSEEYVSVCRKHYYEPPFESLVFAGFPPNTPNGAIAYEI